jgi:hypothetical protein
MMTGYSEGTCGTGLQVAVGEMPLLTEDEQGSETLEVALWHKEAAPGQVSVMTCTRWRSGI